MNLLANAFPSVTWKRSDENYMIDVLEYEPQRESFSCGFYVMAAISDFAPKDSNMPHVNYREYRFKKTCILRDSVVRHFCVRYSGTVMHGPNNNVSRSKFEVVP